jgi:hypothetical protein
VCGFSVYGYVDTGVVSVHGNIQEVDFVVMFYFFSKLYVWVHGVEIIFYAVDIGVTDVIYDEYFVYISEVVDDFKCFR